MGVRNNMETENNFDADLVHRLFRDDCKDDHDIRDLVDRVWREMRAESQPVKGRLVFTEGRGVEMVVDPNGPLTLDSAYLPSMSPTFQSLAEDKKSGFLSCTRRMVNEAREAGMVKNADAIKKYTDQARARLEKEHPEMQVLLDDEIGETTQDGNPNG